MRALREELADLRNCLQCGYNLRSASLSGGRGRCPECGGQADSRTLVIPAWRWGQWPRLWNVPFLIVAVPCVVGVFAIGRFIPTPFVRLYFLTISPLLIGGILLGFLKLWWRVRGGAEGRLIMYRRRVAFTRMRKSPYGLAFSGFGWFRVRRIGAQHWRVKLSSIGRGVDVVIKGDRRRMAAIRAVLKQRMGLTGITGWGTRRRER